MKCGKECEVYSRIVGYFRPVQRWNVGKKEEFKDRLEYDEVKSLQHRFKEEPEFELAQLRAEI
jgi:ribonucleoside-triphosphate reductase